MLSHNLHRDKYDKSCYLEYKDLKLTTFALIATNLLHNVENIQQHFKHAFQTCISKKFLNVCHIGLRLKASFSFVTVVNILTQQ